MWYSSQKITNTRMSSRAASTAACSGDRIGSDVSSSGAAPLAEIILTVSTSCGSPSSRTSKSSFVRSVTGLPFLSMTVTSTRTLAVPPRNTGGC
jgi:hypothetical protein